MEIINKQNKIEELTKQMQELVVNQNKTGMDTYNFSFFQEKRYRVSEKIEEELSENKKLALCIQRKLYKFTPEESVKWIDESKDLFHNWDMPLHKKYLNKAEELLEITDYETAIKMLNAIL